MSIWIVLGLHFVLSAAAIFHCFQAREDVSRKALWSVMIFTLPFVGTFLYATLGRLSSQPHSWSPSQSDTTPAPPVSPLGEDELLAPHVQGD
jgi:hypothetical protein